MAISLKENKFLIDGDILKECLLDNYKYTSADNEDQLARFQRFNELLGKSSGYLYNTEGVEKILQDFASGIEVEGLSPGALYISRINNMIRQTDGTNSSWERLEDSAYTLVEDNNEEWSALFYHKNLNESNQTALDWADKNLSHQIGFPEIFSKRGLFHKLISKSKGALQGFSSPEVFFNPFNLLSKSYIIYDPFLFSGYTSFFGIKKKDNDELIKFKEANNPPREYWTIRNHITLYLDWIYRCYEKSSHKDLPTIYLGGRRTNGKLKFNKNKIEQYKNAFLNEISKSKNKGSSIKIFKEFIDKDKLKFFYIDDHQYKNNSVILHDNAIITDYGIIRWSKRKGLFNDKNYKKNQFKHEIMYKQSMETRNIFNTFRKASIEENDINYFDTFKDFSKIINEQIK